MRRYQALPVGAVAAGLAALLVGCSGSESPKSAAPSETTSSVVDTTSSAAVTTPSVAVTTPTAAVTTDAGVTGEGACKYVTTAQASALAASPVKAGSERSVASGPVTFSYCNYIFDPGNAPGVIVAVASLGGDGASLFAQFRASEQSESDYQVVSGVGDEAFFSGQNLNVRSGDTGLILFVGRSNGYPRGPDGLPDEKKLAALVLSQV